MHRGVRTVLVSTLALVVLAACGDDDDTDPVVTVPDEITAPDDVTLPDVTLPDVTRPDVTIPDITIPDITIPDLSVPDLSVPDLSIPDLSIPDLSLPGGIELPDSVQDLMNDTFKKMGMSQEQVDCLIDRIDPSSGTPPDGADMLELFDECDIDLTKLGGG